MDALVVAYDYVDFEPTVNVGGGHGQLQAASSC
jgi:hypothetical protein